MELEWRINKALNLQALQTRIRIGNTETQITTNPKGELTQESVRSEHILEERYDVPRVLPQLLDFLVTDGCTHLAHGVDDVVGQALDVHRIVVRLLADQVHVQDLHDLRAHAIGSRVQEGEQDLRMSKQPN